MNITFAVLNCKNRLYVNLYYVPTGLFTKYNP
jgi:hypothetical protein